LKAGGLPARNPEKRCIRESSPFSSEWAFPKKSPLPLLPVPKVFALRGTTESSSIIMVGTIGANGAAFMLGEPL
jgi:hypothetical protein